MSTFTKRVASTNDDGYKKASLSWQTGAVYVGGDTYFGNLTAALRFNNVTIPPGSIITSAKITVRSTAIFENTWNNKVHGIDEDDTADFSSDPTGRPKTSASADWDQINFDDEVEYDITGLAAIVQEIVERPGWVAGNDMGFLIEYDGSPSNSQANFYDYADNPSYAALLTVEYGLPTHLINKDLKYAIERLVTISKPLAYVIDYIGPDPVAFFGLKAARDRINVMNTNNPRHLKVSSQFNTLKYDLAGYHQLHVVSPAETEYTVVGYITHNLDYYPFTDVYAKDDLMDNFQPLGRYHAGSGGYRQFGYYMTTTRLYFVVKGWNEEDEDYYVDFYYKIFKNNLNL